VTSGDWAGVVAELRDFKDDYPMPPLLEPVVRVALVFARIMNRKRPSEVPADA
jgi:hypothetical protein